VLLTTDADLVGAVLHAKPSGLKVGSPCSFLFFVLLHSVTAYWITSCLRDPPDQSAPPPAFEVAYRRSWRGHRSGETISGAGTTAPHERPVAG
jgi:hypothetical protein